MSHDPRPHESDAESNQPTPERGGGDSFDDAGDGAAPARDDEFGERDEFQRGDDGVIDGSRSLRIWLTAASIVIPIAIIIWFLSDFFSRRAQPPSFVLLSAGQDSFYFAFGEDLRSSLVAKVSGAALNLQTRGSRDNARILTSDSQLADAAIIQDGSIGLLAREQLAAVSVLFPEVVHILSRDQDASDDILTNLNLNDIWIYAGEKGSGMRESARDVLSHYATAASAEVSPAFDGIFREMLSFKEKLNRDEMALLQVMSRQPEKQWGYDELRQSVRMSGGVAGVMSPSDLHVVILRLLEKGYLVKHDVGTKVRSFELAISDRLKQSGVARDTNQWDQWPDVAIITTAPSNEDFRRLLRDGRYRLLSIEAEALARNHPYFSVHTIPRGQYGRDVNGVPVPAGTVTTVSTNALLVVREDAASSTVKAILRELNTESLRLKQKDLLPADDIRGKLNSVHFHEDARAFYDPFDPGTVAAYVEALAGSKDLIVALFAGAFLLWRVRDERRVSIRRRELAKQHKRLRDLLEATLRIEAAQVEVDEPRQLEKFLLAITHVKTQALKELTHDAIHADQRFSVFLAQCTNVINRIQLRLSTRQDQRENQREDQP